MPRKQLLTKNFLTVIFNRKKDSVQKIIKIKRITN